MKKSVITVIVLAIVVLGVQCVLAQKASSVNLNLVQMDSEGNVVNNGAHGNLFLRQGNKVSATAFGLEAFTDYELIFAKVGTPTVQCLHYRGTTRNGNLKIVTVKFDYSDFLMNQDSQGFALVLKNDVDCDTGKFVKFEPTKYLFQI